MSSLPTSNPSSPLTTSLPSPSPSQQPSPPSPPSTPPLSPLGYKCEHVQEVISSPIADRILEFYDDGGDDLFPPNLQPLLSSNDVTTSFVAAVVAFSPLPSIDAAALFAFLDDL